jgi:aerobic C4-dicarboxylate transport protein
VARVSKPSRLRAGLDNETWIEAQEPEVLLDQKTEHMAGSREAAI